ncbi:hypothetical protein SKAU_G00056680 [Synaphobranchus kaupii]|uniref:Uncharacterized protein n=1 Tax=Synaphobranchus kaupii TaxID=118154 RepID=A0A9Q1G4Y4_SYNKA|nr:hypothetical protein SKAU_G00056680 [Synaphobranchus kaupii]
MERACLERGGVVVGECGSIHVVCRGLVSLPPFDQCPTEGNDAFHPSDKKPSLSSAADQRMAARLLRASGGYGYRARERGEKAQRDGPSPERAPCQVRQEDEDGGRFPPRAANATGTSRPRKRPPRQGRFRFDTATLPNGHLTELSL